MFRMKLNELQLRLSSAGFIAVMLAFAMSRLILAQVPRLPDGDLGGVVTAVTAQQATIKTVANEPFTIVFAANTNFFKQVGASLRTVPAKVTDIQVGNSINVTGHLDPDGTTKHAKIVMILNAETSQKLLAHGGTGISQVSGMVDEINGSKLTVIRYDKVAQVIEVSRETVFFKGSSPATITALLSGTAPANVRPDFETTTLAAVKVGDVVYTVGALKFPATMPLKDNIFVAAKVAVVPKPERVVP